MESSGGITKDCLCTAGFLLQEVKSCWSLRWARRQLGAPLTRDGLWTQLPTGGEVALCSQSCPSSCELSIYTERLRFKVAAVMIIGWFAHIPLVEDKMCATVQSKCKHLGREFLVSMNLSTKLRAKPQYASQQPTHPHGTQSYVKASGNNRCSTWTFHLHQIS